MVVAASEGVLFRSVRLMNAADLRWHSADEVPVPPVVFERSLETDARGPDEGVEPTARVPGGGGDQG